MSVLPLPRASSTAASGQRGREPRRDAGSAYVLVLVVLLVLSLLGLFLALVTQSELAVGANERVVNRVFYGTEAGISASVANYLYGNNRQKMTYTFMDSPTAKFGTKVEVSPLREINLAPCNLCEINQGSDFYNITHQINATANRIGIDSSGAQTVLATKSLELMLAIQPLKETVDVEAYKQSQQK
jgi:Tfp pilus assembly protein PilX